MAQEHTHGAAVHGFGGELNAKPTLATAYEVNGKHVQGSHEMGSSIRVYLTRHNWAFQNHGTSFARSNGDWFG